MQLSVLGKSYLKLKAAKSVTAFQCLIESQSNVVHDARYY